MRRLPLLAVAVALAASLSCVATSATMMFTPVLSLAYTPAPIRDGSGSIGSGAATRLAARPHAALAAATRDALDAAAATPGDLRLQRRAAAMVRELAHDKDASELVADLAPRAAHLIDHLVELAPCPGLADGAATWLALGDAGRGGATYVAASRQCASVEAAVAAVSPLRSVKRCDEAVDALRDAWPRIHGARAELGIAVLDGVAACSDALTLRRNLSFAPSEVVEDYFALREARHRREIEAERRADADRREQEAASRAFSATSRCESECSAAVSSCSSSCAGGANCSERCASVGHVCRSGCGSY